MTALPHPSQPVDPWLWARTATETLVAGLDPAGLALRQHRPAKGPLWAFTEAMRIAMSALGSMGEPPAAPPG